jgi:hypothetical protein
MIWIHAVTSVSIWTIVVDLMSFWNWPHIEDVAYAMNPHGSTADTNGPMSVVLPAIKEPTAVGFGHTPPELGWDSSIKPLSSEVVGSNIWRHIKRFVFDLLAPVPLQRAGASVLTCHPEGSRN